MISDKLIIGVLHRSGVSKVVIDSCLTSDHSLNGATDASSSEINSVQRIPSAIYQFDVFNMLLIFVHF